MQSFYIEKNKEAYASFEFKVFHLYGRNSPLQLLFILLMFKLSAAEISEVASDSDIISASISFVNTFSIRIIAHLNFNSSIARPIPEPPTLVLDHNIYPDTLLPFALPHPLKKILSLHFHEIPAQDKTLILNTHYEIADMFP